MLEALFAAFRISIWFILLFGFIGPLFLEHTRKLPSIEKLMYAWVGLGGVIIFSVFVLSTLHIYDFISFVLTLLLIPLIRNIWKSDKGILEYFRTFEIKSIVSHVHFIEEFTGFSWSAWKQKMVDKKNSTDFKITQTFFAIILALFGGFTRMYPALLNAAPFSRNWYFQLDRVKNLRLQDYFSGYPEPTGMHSLVSVFSMLTQVSPEMILHILGALSSFFLCIVIFWVVKDITQNKYPMAPIMAMAMYAVTPMLFMPLSLDMQIEANSLDLALCFALPTLTIFVRNLRARYKSPWFYVLSGFVATGMTNLFVAFIILLPLMIIGLLSLPRRRYFRSFFKIIGYLLTISATILIPIILYNAIHGIDQFSFFLERLYDTSAYSYYPLLILSNRELSMIYLSIAAIILAGYLIEMLVKRRKKIRDELTFLIIFCGIAMVYSPYFDRFPFWLDADQLNGFYSLLIAALAGIAFSSLLRWGNMILKLKEKNIHRVGLALCIIIISGFLYLQGGIKVSRQLPSTIPNGFSESYYNIIGDYLPYSYATVGPEIERTEAKNRHYFMNYDFFLDQYGAIDSLYHEQLLAPGGQKNIKQVPPASIFIFVEKPPYKGIQQGILYDSPTVMRDVEQWLNAFKKRDDRKMRVYFENKEAIVYQIVNRENESQIGDILLNIYPKKKGLLRHE